MHRFWTPLLLVFFLALGPFVSPTLAQSEPPSVGAPTTFLIELQQGPNLIALPLVPDLASVRSVVSAALPEILLVQDDAGRYLIPAQEIDELGPWAWDEAYKIEVATPTTLTVEGPLILPALSPLLLDGYVGNWVPYLRRTPMAVAEAFASITPSLLRVESADGRSYFPDDDAPTLDTLRAGQGYKVWVSEPVTLIYPPDQGEPTGPSPPAAPSGLVISTSDGSILLDWDDSTEGDLAPTPYTVKRGESAGGPYAPIAFQSESAYTDASGISGRTYYYVVTAIDSEGTESAPSAEVVATLPTSTGPFALPASPTPTATEEAIGMRAEYRADPKGFNNHPTTAYDGATTQGERLWLGLGGTGYDWGHPTPAVEPDGAGGIRATYVTTSGTLAELPPLGTAPGTGGYPAPYIFGHEGTDIGATVKYPDGSAAVHFLIMDGGPSPNFSYRFVEEANGAQRLDTIRVYGTIWENGAKNHALEATDGGMVAIHAHSSPYHTNTPNILVNRGDDANFFVPGSSSGGSANLVFRLGAVADEIYIVTNESPVLSVLYEVGPDSAYVQRRIFDPATFWGNQATITNGFGPTPRYIGPAAANPGFVIYTGSASRLDYHNGTSGSVIPVDEVAAYTYQRLGGETWRITYPDLRVQRLAALNVGPSAATPTWVTEADLDLPAGWDPTSVMHAEITENGSVWLIGERLATFPATGVTANDIAVAYYRGGTP